MRISADALAILEELLHERQRAVVSQVGQRFMSYWPVGLLIERQFSENTLTTMGLLAMTLHRLGQRAQAVLADVRVLLGQAEETQGTVEEILHEAVTLIEGREAAGEVSVASDYFDFVRRLPRFRLQDSQKKAHIDVAIQFAEFAARCDPPDSSRPIRASALCLRR